MHPITDYIPAIALMVASIVIPRESATEEEDDENASLPVPMEVVDSQIPVSQKGGGQTVERSRIRFELSSFARPGKGWRDEKLSENSRWKAIMAAKEKRYASGFYHLE